MSDPPRRRSHRGEGRHDYRHFPPAYTEIVEEFERTGEVRMGPFTRREAAANRYRISRFFGFLRNADPSDEYARSLYRIAGTMVSRIELGPSGPNGPVYLVWYLDPVVSMMRSSTSSDPGPSGDHNSMMGPKAPPEE